jgi:DNA-binding GntR family transcriptional regulator
MPEKFLKSKTLQDAVYEELLHDISSGKLKPNTRITIQGIARDLNVSAQPVREAFHRLSAEKLICIRNRQITVQALNLETLLNVFAIYRVLFEYAMKEAHRKIVKSQRENLKIVLEEIKQTKDTQAFFRFVKRFGNAVFEIASNPVLVETSEFLGGRLQAYISLSVDKQPLKKEEREFFLNCYKVIVEKIGDDYMSVKKMVSATMDKMEDRYKKVHMLFEKKHPNAIGKPDE